MSALVLIALAVTLVVLMSYPGGGDDDWSGYAH